MALDRVCLLVAIALLTAFLFFSFRLYADPPIPGGMMTEEADRGKALWQQYNCTACHQVYGLGGFLGPDLTNAYTRKGPAQIRAFLKTGTKTMPVFPLAEVDIDALVAYFRHIDGTGTGDPRQFTIHRNGTIAQP